ncbi:acid-sensing ion channel 5-like [Condylostylus longicornis]|uniref:acid-sensing ion channel 5-like n=1 Tax=Condylostylus longicornis TaxID=2530218 RepID=UPI00244E1EE7|nr:acid-sensing ion channel 5-like [Condylostylus longicornis]
MRQFIQQQVTKVQISVAKIYFNNNYEKRGFFKTWFFTKNNTKSEYFRIFWLLTVMGSIVTTYIMITNQINRFYNNPTVMSLDRDYRAWNGTLPGLTLCYHDKMDISKADDYIQEKWNITPNDNDYSYFLEFLYAVVNSTAYNYGDLVKFAEDERFDDINLYEIVKLIDRSFLQDLTTFRNNVKVHVIRVMTERGMCYAINAPMAKMLSENNKNIQNIEKSILCEYGKHQCFIKMDIFDSVGTIEVHSPYEVSASDAGVGAIEMIKANEIYASYKVTETFASETLRDLDPEQRKCVFFDEPTSGLNIYSKTLCLARCRAVMALEMCNCVPFFYPFVDGIRCNPAGFECLLDFKWPIWALHICKCPSTCTEHVYSVHSIKTNPWSGTTTENSKISSSFRWDIVPPKVRMRRDVVFSFEDLLVSVGGAIGLFLGASILTLVKIGIISLQWFIENFILLITKMKNCSLKIRIRKRKPKITEQNN